MPRDKATGAGISNARGWPEVEVLNGKSLLRLGLAALLPCAIACSQELPKTNTNLNPQLATIVEQMLKAQSDARPTASYQIIREYRLFADKSPNPSSEVWAEVDYLPPNRKTYAIHKRVGSGRGEDVVRRILERESYMAAGSSGATVDDNNYSFGYLGEATLEGSPCYVLSLNPKRSEVQLVRGKAWVDQHSFRIRRIEGRMAKNPSWLLKKVDLKLDFADIEGTWLQTNMEAVADVRFIGSQTLKSETVDARIGNLITQKTQPEVRVRSGKSNRSQMPATIIAPTDHRQ
jgi:hypothetical protein